MHIVMLNREMTNLMSATSRNKDSIASILSYSERPHPVLRLKFPEHGIGEVCALRMNGMPITRKACPVLQKLADEQGRCPRKYFP